MMRFLLVTSGRRDLMKVWDWQGSSPTGSILPPVDLSSIAASIRAAGGECRIADLRFSSEPLVDYLRVIEEYCPDGVILNLTTTSAEHDYTLIGITPRPVRRFCFGSHAVACPEEAFTKGVDCILVGDPEAAVGRFLTHGESALGGDGLWVRGRANGRPVYCTSLDALPAATPTGLDLTHYRMPFVSAGKPFWLILGSRGGTSGDESSVHSTVFGPVRRERSAAGVCDEIESAIREWRIKFFRFLDVDMNGIPGRVEALCDEIARRSLRFEWAGEFGWRTHDPATAEALAASGLRWACLGLPDSICVDSARRDQSVEEFTRTVRSFQRAGVRVGLTVRLSGATSGGFAEYVDQLVSVLQTIGADAVQCQLAMPFPGSAFRAGIEPGELGGSWSKYDPFGGSVPYSTQHDLVRARRSIHMNWLFAHPIRAIKLAGRMAPRFVGSAGVELIRRDFWPDWQARRRRRMLEAAERLEFEQVYSTSAIAMPPAPSDEGQGCGSSKKEPGAPRLVQLGILTQSRS